MTLSIRAIIKWEQLNQKAFSAMDYGNENDIISLFYVCQKKDEAGITLEKFREGLTDDALKKMVADFEKQILIAAQFQQISKQQIKELEASEPVYISELVPMLVMNGLDVHFALDEMKLYDIPIYLKAYDQRMKNKLESSRLWAFIQVMPHLSKQIKTPKDLYPFSWEIEEQKQQAVEDVEKNIPVFEAFMKSNKQRL